MKEIDAKRELHLLATDPIARNADSDAERRFARAISNARKTPTKRRPLRKPPSTKTPARKTPEN